MSSDATKGAGDFIGQIRHVYTTIEQPGYTPTRLDGHSTQQWDGMRWRAVDQYTNVLSYNGDDVIEETRFEKIED